MPWTNPPNFTDGDYLTATNLNILSDDLEYLHGITYQNNTGFFVREITCGSSGFTTVHSWAIKHWNDTFRYIINVTAGTIDEIKIYANGNTSNVLWSDGGTNPSNPYTWSGTADISARGFAQGEIYSVYIDVKGTGTADVIQVVYLGEDW